MKPSLPFNAFSTFPLHLLNSYSPHYSNSESTSQRLLWCWLYLTKPTGTKQHKIELSPLSLPPQNIGLPSHSQHSSRFTHQSFTSHNPSSNNVAIKSFAQTHCRNSCNLITETNYLSKFFNASDTSPYLNEKPCCWVLVGSTL